MLFRSLAHAIADEHDRVVGDSVRKLSDHQTGDDHLKIAVDYQANTPVYLRWKPALYEGELHRTSSGSHTRTRADASAVLHIRNDGCPDPNRGSTVGTHNIYSDSDTSESSSGWTSSFSATGGRLWAEDKTGTAWLDLRVASGATGSFSANATATWSNEVDEDVWSGISYSGNTARTRDESLDYSNSTGSSYSGEGDTVSLWFLDLRYRAATYTRITQTVAVTTASSGQGTETKHSTDGGTTFTYTGGNSSGVFNNFTSESTVDNRSHYDTRVLFYGTEVRRFSGDYVDLSVPSSSSSGTATVGWSNPCQFGWQARPTNGTTPVVLPNDPVANQVPLANGGWTHGMLASDPVHEAEVLGFYNSNDPYPLDTDGFDFDSPATSLSPDAYTHLGYADFVEPRIANLQATYTLFSGPLGWAFKSLDREGVPFYWNQHELNGGTWLAHQKQWVYSMAAPEGDITEHKWESAIKDDDLVRVTGKRDPAPELFANAWPLAVAVVQK